MIGEEMEIYQAATKEGKRRDRHHWKKRKTYWNKSKIMKKKTVIALASSWAVVFSVVPALFFS